MIIKNRARRLRSTSMIREMIKENHLTASDFIAPLFIKDLKIGSEPISSMPGQVRHSFKSLREEIIKLKDHGIKAVALFPAIDEKLKTKDAKESFRKNNLNFRAIEAVKSLAPDMLVVGDIALDPYSSDGHDGIVDPKTGEILNDETLEVLKKMAVESARAGADILGPSDMMDGRVAVMREELEAKNFKHTLIMSYTAKYASAFYGPFRDALNSAPKKGDKKTYQMDPANAKEAIKEALFDEAEGADILMVKPGMPYLDIIYQLKQKSTLPIAAYQVSGEYAMIKAGAEKGWINHDAVMMESLLSFKRAGADIILTYFALEAARLLNK
jgi:porphobilinogen synthase